MYNNSLLYTDSAALRRFDDMIKASGRVDGVLHRPGIVLVEVVQI